MLPRKQCSSRSSYNLRRQACFCSRLWPRNRIPLSKRQERFSHGDMLNNACPRKRRNVGPGNKISRTFHEAQVPYEWYLIQNRKKNWTI
jgi:hypothetical protein